MNCADALYQLKNLQQLKSLYLRMLDRAMDKKEPIFDLTELIRETNRQIEKIVDTMHNMEFDDSYDPNTGEVNKLYFGDV